MDLSAQYDKIYRYCCFHLRDPQLAEDLTQETFLRFYRQASYQEQGKALAYLYTIARNLCLDAAAGPRPRCPTTTRRRTLTPRSTARWRCARPWTPCRPICGNCCSCAMSTSCRWGTSPC